MQEQRRNPKDIPKTLDDHIFYGLVLDEKQKEFRDMIWNKDKDIILCNSGAGTGKTTIALAVANILYGYGLYDGICYIISPSMEEKQGYLPGDQQTKSAPYMEPLVEALITLNIFPNKAIKEMQSIDSAKQGSAYINFMPHTYLRGTNFENKVVIIDEAQNFYFDELKKTLTRVHDNCKTIVIGHTKQCDLYKNPERSGFGIYYKTFKEKINELPRAAVCELTKNYRGWVSTFCDSVEFNYISSTIL